VVGAVSLALLLLLLEPMFFVLLFAKEISLPVKRDTGHWSRSAGLFPFVVWPRIRMFLEISIGVKP